MDDYYRGYSGEILGVISLLQGGGPGGPPNTLNPKTHPDPKCFAA